MIVSKSFPEHEGMHDSRQIIFLVPCLDDTCTIESFRGKILNKEITDSMNLAHYNAIAEYFDLLTVKIFNNLLIIPAGIITSYNWEAITIEYDNDHYGEPQMQLLESSPQLKAWKRCVLIISPDKTPDYIPKYVKLHGVKGYNINEYYENVPDYDFILIEEVTARYIVDGPYTAIRLGKPFENLEPTEIVVENISEVTDRGGAHLNNSIISCIFPLKMTIEQDDRIVIKLSFETAAGVISLIELRVLQKMSLFEVEEDQFGRYVLPLHIFLMHYIPGPNSCLRFINDGGEPYKVRLMSNPDALFHRHCVSTEIVGSGNLLSITRTRFSSVPPDTSETHNFYTNVSGVCIAENVPTALLFGNFDFFYANGNRIVLPEIDQPLTKDGDHYLLPPGTYYFRGLAEYIKPLFCV